MIGPKLKQFVTDLVGHLDPGDDITPMVLAADENGEMISMLAHVPFEDARFKDELALAMIATLAVTEAVEAAFISCAWTVMRETEPGPDDPLPADCPDRKEVVIAVHHTRDGVTGYQAVLTRHPDRAPTMGAWEEWAGARQGGRFGDAMSMGLKMAAALPDDLKETFAAARADGCEDAAVRGVIRAIKTMQARS